MNDYSYNEIAEILRESSTTIVALLFVWIMFVVIIPSSGGLLASQFYDMPTRREISERIQAAKNAIAKREKGKDTLSWHGTPTKKPVSDAVNRGVKAANDMTDSVNKVRDDYRNKIIQQVKLAQNITRISPSAVYQYASESIDTFQPCFLYGCFCIYFKVRYTIGTNTRA